jgi:hypothetical protein
MEKSLSVPQNMAQKQKSRQDAGATRQKHLAGGEAYYSTGKLYRSYDEDQIKKIGPKKRRQEKREEKS